MSNPMLTAGLLCGLAVLSACGTGPRDPVLGTPGPSFSGPSSPLPGNAAARARAESNADRQPTGVENGNQPDRAAAGGGAR